MVDCPGRFQFARRRIWGDQCTYSESLSLLPSPRAAFRRHHHCLENRVTCYSARCSSPSTVLTPRWLDRLIEQKFSLFNKMPACVSTIGRGIPHQITKEPRRRRKRCSHSPATEQTSSRQCACRHFPKRRWASCVSMSGCRPVIWRRSVTSCALSQRLNIRSLAGNKCASRTRLSPLALWRVSAKCFEIAVLPRAIFYSWKFFSYSTRIYVRVFCYEKPSTLHEDTWIPRF